jgi:hypothetical protein
MKTRCPRPLDDGDIEACLAAISRAGDSKKLGLISQELTYIFLTKYYTFYENPSFESINAHFAPDFEKHRCRK